MADINSALQDNKKKIYPSLSSFSQSQQPASQAPAQDEKKPVSQEPKPPEPAQKQEIKPPIQPANPSSAQPSWKSQAQAASPSKPSYESTPRYPQGQQAQPKYPQSSWKNSYAGSGSSTSGTSYERRGIPFRLYKATKANSGSAMSLDLNAEKQSIFIDISKQIGEQKFDWDNKITMKLSITDIGKMLAVLTGSLKNSKLYHDPSKGQYESAKDTRNTVLEFSKGISFGYTLKASEQGTNGSVQSIVVPISEDEGEVICVLLEASIRKIYGW